MKLELGTVGFGIGAALVVVVAGALIARRFAPKLDPTNPENIFNEGASSIVSSVTGGAAAGGEDSIGGLAARFREWVSGDDAKIQELKKGAPAGGVSSLPAGTMNELPWDFSA